MIGRFIGHILDRMIDLEPEEIILVVGYRKSISNVKEDDYKRNFKGNEFK